MGNGREEEDYPGEGVGGERQEREEEEGASGGGRRTDVAPALLCALRPRSHRLHAWAPRTVVREPE